MPFVIIPPRTAAVLLLLAVALTACATPSPGLGESTPALAPVVPTVEPLPASAPTLEPSPTPAPTLIGFVGHIASAPAGSIAALSLEGAHIAAAAHLAQLDVVDIDALDSADPAAAIGMTAERGAIIIIVAGSELADAARAAAQNYPAIKFVGVDQPADDSLANYFTLGEPGDRLDEEAFLAGALAGLVTTEREVGIAVVGGERESKLYENGFRHGVRYTCGDCELWVVTLTDPNDTVAGTESAARLQRARVDVMFAASGPAGDSGLEAAAALGMWVIWSGRDLTAATDRALGSILRRPDLSLPGLIGLILNGESPPHAAFALANGNLSLAENFGPDVSPAVIQLMSDVVAQLSSGALDTGVDLAAGEEK
ncbi:MAG: BMP family ABC transporter substrate-binding protein [Chloroflexi bacterium]|nr:BMP family ABC transporter substrate-binding protein [Chloroflexota bacterium]